MGLLGILLGLALLVGLAYRGWSVLGLAPLAALVAAAFAGEPLLAHWTQTFMGSAAGFIAQFFPLFLLGALFGKLMDDSGSVTAIANFMTEKLGPSRSVLAVVLAGALVTYGGVSLFVAMFVIAPMGQALFRAADIPNRLLAPAVALGTTTFTMTAMPGTPAIQNAIPMPFFGTTPFAAPGLGLIASAVMLGFGLWWLARAEKAARVAGEGFGGPSPAAAAEAAHDPVVRERATTSQAFDPAEAEHGQRSAEPPGIVVAMLPLAVVMAVNLAMSLLILPRLDTSWLAEPQWGGTSIAGVGGVWSVIVALSAAIVVLYVFNRGRLKTLRETVDAGLNASALPVISVASLVGFGAVVAALPAFQVVSDWVLGIEGGPLVGLALSDQRAVGTHRLGLGRLDHRPRRPGRDLYAAGCYLRHRPGADAPRRRHRRRLAGQPAAQRRGGHAAGGVRQHAQTELLRHRHGRHRQCAAGVGGGDRARHDVRQLLTHRGWL